MDGLRRSCLHERHVALGAKLVPFGGWEMPLSYPAGTIEEHLACRRDAVVFDVSHLGTVRLGGPGAVDRVQRTLTNDLGKIAPGRAQYTHLLDEADASVLDDIIVWWIADDRLDVMPNASNTARVLAAVGGEDVTATRAILAVQGPAARQRVEAVFPEAAATARFRVARLRWHEHDVTVAGTGYTGEDGIEIAVPAAGALALWDALTGAGVTPAGLGARDTLRLEAALPLHGHELGPGITPLEAGLGWVVAWETDFRGKAALDAHRRAGVHRRLRGIVTAGRRPPRAGAAVWAGGEAVGTITSGNFSPVLGHGIALAFLPSDTAEGLDVEVEVRGGRLPGTVSAMPFVAKH